MRSLKRFIYAIIISSIMFSACSPAYIPNVVNTPLLKEKGDAKLNANFGVSGNDFQLAYAVSDNIGLMLNTSFEDTKDNDSTGYYHKHNFVEFGVGYFSPVGNIGIASIYGGLGFGNVNSNYNSVGIHRLVNANSIRFFLQPSIGVRSNSYEGSLSSRVVGVMIFIPDNERMAIFIEPAITNKVGFKYGKFVVQTGFSIPVSTTNLGYDYLPFLFSLGLELNLSAFIKKNQLKT